MPKGALRSVFQLRVATFEGTEFELILGEEWLPDQGSNRAVDFGLLGMTAIARSRHWIYGRPCDRSGSSPAETNLLMPPFALAIRITGRSHHHCRL